MVSWCARGRAIAELVFGECVPEGKLPITFYRSTEELPEFTDYSMKDRTYRFMKNEALYPFGYGLSYTDFIFSDLSCNRKEVTGEGIDVSVKVKNEGKLAGRETIQVYIKAKDLDSPNAQLKAFQKVELNPKEEKTITLHLPIEAFSLFDENGKQKVQNGGYTMYVGGSQPDQRSIELTGKKPLEIEVISSRTFEIE